MSSETGARLPKSLESGVDVPFGGLFGDTAELRVLHEIVADPYSDYTQQDLMELTGLSDPSVRKGVQALIRHGVVKNTSSVRRRPIYRANLESKKLLSLTFLTYAVLDERAGGRSLEGAIREYADSLPPGGEILSLADDSNIVRYGRPQCGQTDSAEDGFRMIVEAV